MNLKQALSYSRKVLKDNRIDEAALEGEVLLRHLLKLNRAQLFSCLDIELDAGQIKSLERLLRRRVRGEPLAYITGHREFFGLDFKVNRNVLIPRPETEILVEKAIELANTHRIDTIADIGTGCGVVAISLAVRLWNVKIYATDISSAALEVAAANCKKHRVSERIKLMNGDMLEPVPGTVDMIVANLPYVRTQDLPGSDSASYEPSDALNGGPDGLDKIKQLIMQAGSKLNTGGYILTEIGQGQKIALSDFVRGIFPEAYINFHNDLAGIKRIMEFRLTKNSP